MSIFSLLVPRVCELCGAALISGERCICLACRAAMPPCAVLDVDPATRVPALTGRVMPLFTYTHTSPVATLLRRGKYSDRPELIRTLADIHARNLFAAGLLCDIDALIPVPMHWLKRLRRGYNQADEAARVISRIAGIPVIHAVTAVRGHKTQTRASAAVRAGNVAGIFAPTPAAASIKGMNVAIVDDILTTGATITQMINAIAPADPAKTNLIVLGIAP